jgi:hypothetical protein
MDLAELRKRFNEVLHEIYAEWHLDKPTAETKRQVEAEAIKRFEKRNAEVTKADLLGVFANDRNRAVTRQHRASAHQMDIPSAWDDDAPPWLDAWFAQGEDNDVRVAASTLDDQRRYDDIQDEEHETQLVAHARKLRNRRERRDLMKRTKARTFGEAWERRNGQDGE